MSTELEKQSGFRFKADYTLPFNEDEKLEAGLQSRIDNESEENTFFDYDQSSDSWIINDAFTSSTDFRRAVHAAYCTYSNKIAEFKFMGEM